MVTVSLGQVDDAHLGTTGGTTPTTVSIASNDLTTASDAQAALTNINAAIASIASLRGSLGASSNQLSAATNVMNSQITNLTECRKQHHGRKHGRWNRKPVSGKRLSSRQVSPSDRRTRCGIPYSSCCNKLVTAGRN